MMCSIEVSPDLGTDSACLRPPAFIDQSGRAICKHHAKFVKESRKESWVAV